jgi:hypothetical protein
MSSFEEEKNKLNQENKQIKKTEPTVRWFIGDQVQQGARG